MMPNLKYGLVLGAGCLLAGALALQLAQGNRSVHAAEPETNPLMQYYGFKKTELFKLKQRSGNLLAADLNGDGRTDLILVDNSNSRLDLLQQRDKPDPATAAASGKVNAIENDWRFEHKKIGVDREVAALTVGDFNSDGKTDIAMFAVPDQLTMLFQREDGDWSKRTRVRLPDVQPQQWILAAGDLNHDQRDDLVVLGKHTTYVLYQEDEGEFSTPAKLMNTTENLGLVQIADLDGDGRKDLCYIAADDQERPFCARLQRPDGRLGAEIRCEMTRPRGITLVDLDGQPGQEILAIEAQTGRVKVYQLQLPETQPGELAGQLIQYGFGQQAGGRLRDLAIGDLNGDGLNDVVVTDPESAQMIVFAQLKGAGLDQGSTFPGLSGAEQVRVGMITDAKRGDVVVLSTREKSIGLSQMKEGRLTFPQGIPLDKEPVALEVADVNGDGRAEVIYLGKERTSQSTKYSLQALAADGEGGWKTHQFGGEASVALTLKTAPDRLMALDANHDGRTDFLVFAGVDKAPQFFLQNEQGKLVEVAADGGGSFALGNVSAGGLNIGLLDKPVVLVAQSNFARNVELGPNNQWRVIDQYNAAESSAKIAGAATIDIDAEPGREIVLVDLGVNKLRVLRREETVFRPWREVEIGAFPYKSTHVADLNGDGRDDLLLAGTGKFGVLYVGQTDPRLKVIGTFESKLADVRFNDLVAGDLNSDGLTDVAVIDTQSQFIELLNYTKEHGLRHALSFKVFEAKSISGSVQPGSEPREAVIADVTGDKLLDLILLSHDRVLVYPQDDGRE